MRIVSFLPIVTSILTVTGDLHAVSLTFPLIYCACFLPQNYTIVVSLIFAGIVEDIFFQHYTGITSFLFLFYYVVQTGMIKRISSTGSFWLYWGQFTGLLGGIICLKAFFTQHWVFLTRDKIILLLIVGTYPLFHKRFFSHLQST